MAARTKATARTPRPSREGKRPLTTFQLPNNAIKVRRLCIKLGVSQDDFVAFAVNRLLSDLGQKPALQVPEPKAKILEAYVTGNITLPKSD